MVVIYSSPRIVIKQFLAGDEELFSDFFNDEDVVRYLPPYKSEDYKKVFAQIFSDYTSGPFGRWGVFDAINGAYIGNCLLRILAEDNHAFEIGYSIGKKYWGAGIGSEIANALVAYAFSKTENGDLTALTHPDNIGSQKVLENAGFSRDGNIERAGNDLFLFRLKR